MLFFFNDTATTEIYTLSLHDALPICQAAGTEVLGELAPLLDGFLGTRLEERRHQLEGDGAHGALTIWHGRPAMGQRRRARGPTAGSPAPSSRRGTSSARSGSPGTPRGRLAEFRAEIA